MNLPVIDLPFLLDACRDRAYRESVRKMVRALVEFLEDEGLVRDKKWSSKQRLPDNLRITETDLTEEGRVFYRSAAIHKWMKYVDGPGREKDDVRPMKRKLKQMREPRP